MTPERFSGAWRQTSISVDGQPPRQPADVIWIQADDVYADLRVPKHAAHPVACFAGTTTWDAPHLCWAHHLDLTSARHEDVGAMVGEGDELVEAGWSELDGRRVPYVECWEREPGSTGPLLALTRRDGLGTLVQAGDHALTVCDDRPRGGEYRACYRTRVAGTWSIALTLGPHAPALPEPPQSPAEPGAWLPLDAHQWQVVRAQRADTDLPLLHPYTEGVRT
jgi:hypothetical protein